MFGTNPAVDVQGVAPSVASARSAMRTRQLSVLIKCFLVNALLATFTLRIGGISQLGAVECRQRIADHRMMAQSRCQQFLAKRQG
jgi:hypothetical protein